MIHSIRDYYPEASNWTILQSALCADRTHMIHVIEITTHDGAHFIDAFILDKTQHDSAAMQSIRLIDFS